jgi:hypothetical protein
VPDEKKKVYNLWWIVLLACGSSERWQRIENPSIAGITRAKTIAP